MEQLTNRHNLPPEIVAALTKDRYNPDSDDIGDFSASSLIAPIQQTILKQRHKDNLAVRDVIDNFYAFVGSIAHKVLEEHGSGEALIEKRMFANVFDKKISGQVDHYKSGIITDYKSTKAYKIIKGGFDDWEKQLNIYSYLFQQNNLPVKELQIFAFILDWKEHETYQKDYPQIPIVRIPLRLWSNEETRAYIASRVITFDRNLVFPDEMLLQCTNAEMWCDIKDWALLKKDGSSKRAIKVFKTESEMLQYSPKCDEYIAQRMTERTRCKSYCPVSHVCKQYQEYIGQIEEPLF